MAYAALASLKYTIDLHINSSRVSIHPKIEQFRKQIQEFLHELISGQNLKRWDENIRKAAFELEDSLECHVSEQFLKSQGEMNLQGLEEAGICFEAAMGKIREEYCQQYAVSSSDFGGTWAIMTALPREILFFNHFNVDDWMDARAEHNFEDPSILTVLNKMVKEQNDNSNDDTSVLPSRTNHYVADNKSKMVGVVGLFNKIRYVMLEPYSPLLVIPVFGMAGIGKTKIMEEIFEDPLLSRHFLRRAWVKVGHQCLYSGLLASIVVQLLSPDQRGTVLSMQGIFGQTDDKSIATSAVWEHIFKYLMTTLVNTRFLIVLDDVWTSEVWDRLKGLFPDDIRNGSRILLTTRNEEVARTANHEGVAFKISFLNKEDSWHLLRKKVFGDQDMLCPPELEKPGKKIAENCQGLPLTIVTVAKLLAEEEDKSPEYWNKVSEKDSSVFVEAYDQMSDVLLLSYVYLHEHVKACFLSMGAFPQNYEILICKLFKLWRVEGFLESNPSNIFKEFEARCLDELVSRSLVLAHQRKSISSGSSVYKIKSSSLHSSIWYMCKKEAGKNKFFHILNRYDDALAEGVLKSQRRLCIHNNVLFAIKDVYASMLDNCGSTARSLLCLGQYHQYPVPICFDLRLLRIVDALTIRLYEFPLEVLELILLRYLALTFNGNLPSSIFKLWQLQYLIVCPTLNIKSPGSQSFLPTEIWDMKELKHLQFIGNDLPDPCGAILPNLSTLSGVSHRSCTRMVLKGIPNLRKLGVQIELEPEGGGAELLSCFDHISRLRKLGSLKCVIVNPNPTSYVIPTLASKSCFPKRLKKLTLSGFGFPWKEMSKIAALPMLEVLKLQCYAFRGPIWEIEDENAFPSLRHLVIEDTDLVYWRSRYASFEYLIFLSIKNCYKLEEFPEMHLYNMAKIEVVDCNPSTVAWTKQMKDEWHDNYRQYHGLDVTVRSSWDDSQLS